tara:strand:+ start:528 stop:767 length:240 start_codon:yes stop_codon:yes gene_type:complete
MKNTHRNYPTIYAAQHDDRPTPARPRSLPERRKAIRRRNLTTDAALLAVLAAIVVAGLWITTRAYDQMLDAHTGMQVGR